MATGINNDVPVKYSHSWDSRVYLFVWKYFWGPEKKTVMAEKSEESEKTQLFTGWLNNKDFLLTSSNEWFTERLNKNEDISDWFTGWVNKSLFLEFIDVNKLKWFTSLVQKFESDCLLTVPNFEIRSFPN